MYYNLKEPLTDLKLLLHFSCGNITFKLDNLLFTKKYEVNKLSANNYRNAFEIVNSVFRRRAVDIDFEKEYTNELINLDPYAKGPSGVNYGDTDVSTTVLRSFFYIFKFIENAAIKRDFSPLRVMFNSFESTNQGYKRRDLNTLLDSHFDEVEVVLNEIKKVLDDLHIFYMRGGFFHEKSGVKDFASEDVPCLVGTKYIFTIYKLRFLALAIRTYQLEYGRQIIID